MMLGQRPVKKNAKQRAAKNAREHDQADCDGTHDHPPTQMIWKLKALGVGNSSRQGAKSPSLEGKDENSYE
jgi:hypothetical protein